jgi:hypothetical protein
LKEHEAAVVEQSLNYMEKLSWECPHLVSSYFVPNILAILSTGLESVDAVSALNCLQRVSVNPVLSDVTLLKLLDFYVVAASSGNLVAGRNILDTIYRIVQSQAQFDASHPVQQHVPIHIRDVLGPIFADTLKTKFAVSDQVILNTLCDLIRVMMQSVSEVYAI